MNIKLVDFSQGIREEEINYNLNVLQEQINRERKNVGGAGVASGLEITPIVTETEFAVSVSEATIISKDGEEIHIPETKLNIDRPKLAKEIEYLTCNAMNQVKVKHVPYALNRIAPVETLNLFIPSFSGIEIKYRDSIAEDDYIRVRAINDKTISLTGITRRDIVMTYYFTDKRIDTIYIDKNDNLKVMSSTTSPTPSVMLPNDYKYLIAFIEIDGMFVGENGVKYGNITVRKDLRDIRNIYTDQYGELWLCGIPFKNLQIIHLNEPKDPKEYTMWYDVFTNTLKTWRTCDNLFYINEYTVTTDYADNPNALKDYPTDMYYYVGKKQLRVYINDEELSEDQFAEIINGIPADKQDIKRGVMTNMFRILTDLRLGDKIKYMITNFDAHEMWVPVNHSSYINVKETRIYSNDSEPGAKNYFASPQAIALGKDTSAYPYKYQYFLFHREEEINMMFTPGKKELSLLINQIPLHEDQFEEITIYDLYSGNLPTSIIDAAKGHFGWDNVSLEQINADYENTGIGFKIKQPLDVDINEEDNGATDLCIEASVQRRVNDGPLKRKLQRTATFSDEVTVDLSDETVIPIANSYYRYGENQLEVFIDGVKLMKDIDFQEGTDLSDQPSVDDEGNVTALAPRRRGARSKQFTLTHARPGSKLTYRIETNIYTYEHITDLIDELDYNAMTAVKRVNTLYDKTLEIQEDVTSNLNEIKEQIKDIEDISGNLEGYVKKDDVLDESQMPPEMVKNSIKSLDHIMTTISYDEGTPSYSIKNQCREEDFIVAIKRSNSNQLDKLLIRNVDYKIYNTFNRESGAYEDTIFALTSSMSPLTSTGDTIILTGIKIGKAGR